MLIFSVYLVTLFLCGYFCQDNPCYDGWEYSKINGKCYSNTFNVSNQSDAATICTNSLISKDNSFTQFVPRLVRILNINDATAIKNRMIVLGNNAPLWMDAKINSATNQFQWSDKTLVDMTVLRQLVPTLSLSSDCVTFQYNYIYISGTPQIQYNIMNDKCENTNTFMCEHETKSCDLALLQMQPESMELIPNSIYVGSYPYVSCKSGYYRSSNTIQTGPVPINYAYCTGTRDGSKNPALYNTNWNVSKIDTCQPVSCAPFSGVLNNVQNQIPQTLINSQTSFSFGYTFKVNCARGFVNYMNSSSAVSSIVCQQSTTDNTQGFWGPINYTPCVAIKCEMSVLTSMIPTNALIQSVRNKVTQQPYDVTFQTSFIPLFNNIVGLQCIDGYFYPDRSWVKQVICDLNNNSLITASWQGYMGTILPLFNSCQNVTCKYEAIFITSNMNIQAFYQILNNLGVFVNQTQSNGNPFPYQTQLLFTCISGYSTATGSSAQTLNCGPQGNWIPNLTPCISIIPALNTGKAQHYIPDAVEASSAKQIGLVAIGILIIFFSLIVILDMSTLARDAKVMRTNIIRLKAAIRRNKQKLED